MHRLAGSLTATELVWAALYLGGVAANMAWAAACRRPPSPGDSYVRFREPLLALLITIDAGVGCAAAANLRAMAGLSPPPLADGMRPVLANTARLVHASCAIGLALTVSLWRVRLRWVGRCQLGAAWHEAPAPATRACLPARPPAHPPACLPARMPAFLSGRKTARQKAAAGSMPA